MTTDDHLTDALQLTVLLRLGLTETHFLLDRTPARANPFLLAFLQPGHYHRLVETPGGEQRRRPDRLPRPVPVTAAEVAPGRFDFVLDAAAPAPESIPGLVSEAARALTADGVWAGTIALGESSTHYLSGRAQQAGLSVSLVATPSIAEHRWFAASRRPATGRAETDLGLSAWMTAIAGRTGTVTPTGALARCGMI